MKSGSHPRHGSSPITLDEMWDHQGERLQLAAEWWALAGGKPGWRVADVGCGPGRISLAYAEWAGSQGFVLAADPAPDALEFVEKKREGASLGALALDAEKDLLPGAPYDAVFLTNVLHHVEHPVVVLKNLVSATRTLLVAEFDPEGPGEIGPPPHERVPPTRLLEWLGEAGWRAGSVRKQAMEHYCVLATRS
ncbi:MAG: class I SAM-dependent methyltransferase [Candidatus Thermoplasmatota archaeon]